MHERKDAKYDIDTSVPFAWHQECVNANVVMYLNGDSRPSRREKSASLGSKCYLFLLRSVAEGTRKLFDDTRVNSDRQLLI